MTRKDYVLLANAIRSQLDATGSTEGKMAIDRVVQQICDDLKDANIHFNRSKFIEAVYKTEGVEPVWA